MVYVPTRRDRFTLYAEIDLLTVRYGYPSPRDVNGVRTVFYCFSVFDKRGRPLIRWVFDFVNGINIINRRPRAISVYAYSKITAFYDARRENRLRANDPFLPTCRPAGVERSSTGYTFDDHHHVSPRPPGKTPERGFAFGRSAASTPRDFQIDRRRGRQGAASWSIARSAVKRLSARVSFAPFRPAAVCCRDAASRTRNRRRATASKSSA